VAVGRNVREFCAGGGSPSPLSGHLVIIMKLHSIKLVCVRACVRARAGIVYFL
jgi:hypothetical protein